jgi:hypothetical protein
MNPVRNNSNRTSIADELSSRAGRMTRAAGGGGRRKDKRLNIGPAAWRHQNRYALNEAHIPFDLLFAFFFFAITLLLAFDAPRPFKMVVHYK